MKQHLTEHGAFSLQSSTQNNEAVAEYDAALSNISSGESSRDDASPGVTRRAVVLSLVLAIFFGYIIPIIDLKFSNTYLGAAHLPPGAIAVLLVLIWGINPLLGKLVHKSRPYFSRNEALTVYITCLFSCLTPGHGAENFFISSIIGPFYFATPENEWLQWIQPYVRHWFTPAISADGRYREQVAGGWYAALSSEAAIPWQAWLLPLITWSLLILSSYFMLACLGVLLRRQWAEHEVLSFPLLRVPLEMTQGLEDKSSFFRHPLMWAGFSVAMLVQMLNGLHLYFPDVPYVETRLDLWWMFYTAGPPLSEVPWFTSYIYFVVIGISYLITTEISFSLWFFLVLTKLQYITAYYLGFTPSALPRLTGHVNDSTACAGYQAIGAYFIYVLILLWTARHHLGHVISRSVPFIGKRVLADEAEKREALSYPVAFWGFILSFGFMLLWTVANGVRLDVALIFWLIYLVISIVLTRVIAEGGLLFVQQGWTPLGAMAQLTTSGAGTWLAPQSLVPLSFVQTAMVTDLRAFLLPSFLQSFKLAHERNIRARPLLLLIGCVVLITFSMSVWMNVRLGYLNGGLQLNGWYAQAGPQSVTRYLQGINDIQQQGNITNWLWMAAGGSLTALLILLRSRFLWFPLHPMGYLVSLSYPMQALGFSIFLGWLCKVLIMHYGGRNAYRAAMPFFWGLILGDVIAMLFWLCIDGWQGRMAHQLMPG